MKKETTKPTNTRIILPKNCTHIKQPVTVGKHIIYCSGLSYIKTIQKPYPDLGIYFSQSWNEINPTATAINVPKFSQEHSLYPNIQVDWTDGADFETYTLTKLISVTTHYLNKGKKVEIGCFGGHGRTGTFLACLIGKVEGLKGEDAIDRVHKIYCREAIETLKQRNMIKLYLGHNLPLEKEIKPIYSTQTYQYEDYLYKHYLQESIQKNKK